MSDTTNRDELPGMWESADSSGGLKDQDFSVSTPEIPALLEVLEKHQVKTGVRDMAAHCICGWSQPIRPPETYDQLHRVHQAEAYREARTIPAAEVAEGWVVRSPAGTVAGRFRTRGVVLGDDRSFPWTSLASPALVLWTPRDEASR